LSEFLSPEAFEEDKKATKKTREKLLQAMKSRNIIPPKKLTQFEKDSENFQKSRKKIRETGRAGQWRGMGEAGKRMTVQEAVKFFTQALACYVQQVLEDGVSVLLPPSPYPASHSLTDFPISWFDFPIFLFPVFRFSGFLVFRFSGFPVSRFDFSNS
jgi:hypothetical protein